MRFSGTVGSDSRSPEGLHRPRNGHLAGPDLALERDAQAGPASPELVSGYVERGVPRIKVGAPRREELLESFVAYCRQKLQAAEGSAAVDYLKSVWGFTKQSMEQLGMGLYPTQQEVVRRLMEQGFHREEILDAAVAGDPRLEGRIIVPWRDRLGRISTVAAVSEGRQHFAGERSLYLRGGVKADPYGMERAATGSVEHLVLTEGLLETAYLQSIGLENVVAFGSAGKLVGVRLWEHLAALGVKRVTIAFADDEQGRARALLAIRQASLAEAAPEVYAIPTGALGTALTAGNFARRRGLEALVAVLEQQQHGYTFAAQVLIRKHLEKSNYGRLTESLGTQALTHWTDSSLLALLEEALEFDAEVEHADRCEWVQKFFWPSLFRGINSDWDSLKVRFGRRLEDLLRRRQVIERRRKYRLLWRDLNESLRRDDLRLFEALIISCADEIRGSIVREEVRPAPLEPLAAPPAEHRPNGDWVVEPEFGREPTTDEIRLAAYYMWQAAGSPDGQQEHFRQRAEQWLRGKQPRTSNVGLG